MSSLFRFTGRIFYWILSFFLVFVCCFVGFQYHRERVYKSEILNTQLQDFNASVADAMREGLSPGEYLAAHGPEGLRLTVMDEGGTCLYDSHFEDVSSMPDHSERKEVGQALTNGSGYDIKRTSQTLGKPYFYAASAIAIPPDDSLIVIRSALPYDISLVKMLSADNGFLWFALAMTVVLMALCYVYASKLGRNIEQLRIFSEKAERNDDLSESSFVFADSDLGEISQNIVRLYTQLQNSEDDKTRLKRQLTQNIAHELKTPVSSIHAYLETITSDPDIDMKTKEEFLRRCFAQSTRLSQLLADISLLTRMDEAMSSFEQTSVNIHELVETIMSDVALQLNLRRMTMFNLIDSDLVVSGDQALLYSIFRNLTDNSIAYAGEGTTITVRYMGEEPGMGVTKWGKEESGPGRKFAQDNSRSHGKAPVRLCRFIFADNGVGVPPQHLPFLFERFYRVDKGRSRKLGGTGLGLAIVKNAVHLHGGTISANLSPETGGLEFNFTLVRA